MLWFVDFGLGLGCLRVFDVGWMLLVAFCV